ncbi:MAG TPA: hypothetical protein VLJ59_17045 [Mycobacteriales bacterium]|nr:hypothetical protein [Mycobacteriales bacterium]
MGRVKVQRDRLRQVVEERTASVWASLAGAPIVRAVGIVRDYAGALYYPIDHVPRRQRLRITPLLTAVEYLVYRVDSLAERNTSVDLDAIRIRDYYSFHTYKRVFERALQAVGAWNDEVARQVDEGERFIRLENAMTSRGNPSHEDVLAMAELRPTDVRMLHAMTAALRGIRPDAQMRDLLWPVEVLADIANDLTHYEKDVAASTFNVYAAFVDLYGDEAATMLRREVDRYEALFEQRLAAFPPVRRDEIARLCRPRYAAAVAAYPNPIPRPAEPVPGKKAPEISWSVFLAGTACVIAWVIAYAAIIRRGFADSTFGVPIPALAANLSWEFVYGFLLDPLGDYIHILSIPCFVIDLVIAWQAWKYGKADFASPFVRDHFHAILTGAIAFAMPAMYLSFVEFNDPDGEYTGFGINLMMSILYIAMLERRNSIGGQSMYVAVFKWIGTFLAWLATALTVTTSPEQPLPRSFREFASGSFRHRDYPLTPLINVTYWATFAVDAVYSRMLYKKIRAAGESPWRRF